MTPHELLYRHASETLPWLRRQVPLSRHAFAAWLGVPLTTVTGWELGTSSIPLVFLRRLVPLVARYLTTEAGRALLLALAEEGGTLMPYVVNVQLTIDTEDPDEAVAFVRAELAKKLPSDDQPWQTATSHQLPRWQVAGARRVRKVDERGFPAA